MYVTQIKIKSIRMYMIVADTNGMDVACDGVKNIYLRRILGESWRVAP